jgi:hypothetical protein
VWLRSGDRLQPFKVHSRREHRPVAVTFVSEHVYPPVPPNTFKFSGDLLMRGVLHGFRTAQLNRALDEWAIGLIETGQWKDIIANKSPNLAWQTINEGARQVALELYSEQCRCSEQHKQLKQEVKHILRQRCDTMQQLVLSLPCHVLKQCMKAWSIAARLQRADKQLRHINKVMHAERREALETELWHAWETRDLAHTWKVARLLGNKPIKTVGARNSLTLQEWTQGLTRAGEDGGCAAVQVASWDRWAEQQERQMINERGHMTETQIPPPAKHVGPLPQLSPMDVLRPTGTYDTPISFVKGEAYMPDCSTLFCEKCNVLPCQCEGGADGEQRVPDEHGTNNGSYRPSIAPIVCNIPTIQPSNVYSTPQHDKKSSMRSRFKIKQDSSNNSMSTSCNDNADSHQHDRMDQLIETSGSSCSSTPMQKGSSLPECLESTHTRAGSVNLGDLRCNFMRTCRTGVYSHDHVQQPLLQPGSLSEPGCHEIANTRNGATIARDLRSPMRTCRESVHVQAFDYFTDTRTNGVEVGTHCAKLDARSEGMSPMKKQHPHQGFFMSPMRKTTSSSIRTHRLACVFASFCATCPVKR